MTDDELRELLGRLVARDAGTGAEPHGPLQGTAPPTDEDLDAAVERVYSRLSGSGLLDEWPDEEDAGLTDRGLAEVLAEWSASLLALSRRPAPHGRFSIELDDELNFERLVGRPRRNLEPWPRLNVTVEGGDSSAGSVGAVVAVQLIIPDSLHQELLVRLRFDASTEQSDAAAPTGLDRVDVAIAANPERATLVDFTGSRSVRHQVTGDALIRLRLSSARIERMRST